MIKAIAPKGTRGPSKLWLTVALASAWPITVLAQASKPAPPAAKAAQAGKASASKDAPADADAAGPEVIEPAKQPKGTKEVTEVFRDDLTEEVLKNTKNFKALSGPAAPATDQIRKMAQNLVKTEDGPVGQFVKSHTAAMAKGEVIRKLASKNAAQNQEAVEAVEKEYSELLLPITDAQKADNGDFLKVYARALVDAVKPLLANHLYARIEGMILLGKTGDQAVVPLLIAQLQDKNQVVMVKLQAAHGLTMVTQRGRRRITPPNVEIGAATAVNNFLKDEPDAIWPARFRAIEALGCLRQPSVNAALGDFTFVQTAADILADAKARPEVRAWAAWALGMIRVGSPNPKVDYRAIAVEIGQLSADLGDRIVKIRSGDGALQAADLTALLAYPLYNSVKGEPGVIGSGLLASNGLGNAKPFVAQLEPLLKAEAAAAVELERTPAGLLAGPRKHMADSVAALRRFLADPPAAAAGNGVAERGARGPNPK